MSELDVRIQNIIPYVFLSLVLLYFLIYILPEYIKVYIATVNSCYFKNLLPYREKLLKEIDNTPNTIKILELRLNQGENLNFYPSQSEIFVLTATQKQAITALTSKCCNYAKLEPKLENLKDFDDGEIDIVVGTSALCRCRDQTKLLREIYRVLSVGGKYYFIEHTNNGSLDPFSFIVKEILAMLGKFWFFDMCLLNSDPYNLIIEAGFKEVHCENTVIKSNISLLQLIENHIIGTAIK